MSAYFPGFRLWTASDPRDFRIPDPMRCKEKAIFANPFQTRYPGQAWGPRDCFWTRFFVIRYRHSENLRVLGYEHKPFFTFFAAWFPDVRVAAGDLQVAQAVLDALRAAGFQAKADSGRGLDHGVWVPLLHMFPQADLPVIPVSLQHHAGPEHAYRIGQSLAPLAEQGFLIVGSGNVTHNLRDWQMVQSLWSVCRQYARRRARISVALQA